MASERSKRRSVRQATSRKRSIYAEPDTDDDFEITAGVDTQFEELPLRRPSNTHKRRKATRSRPLTRSKASSRAKSAPRSRGKKRNIWALGKARKSRTSEDTEIAQFDGPSDHRIPAWTTLPITILRDIFSYALCASNDQTRTSSARVNWLMSAARTCRAFLLPALEAYYESPILTTLAHPHLLIDLLETPNESRRLNYNTKIRSLQLDVQMLAYTATHRGHVDIGRLVAQLPQLQDMEIRHSRNEPPFRPRPIQKWTYPPSLLGSLVGRDIRLKSWRWVREMFAEPDVASLFESMLRFHTSSPFGTIQRLVICDFNAGDIVEALETDRNGDVSAGGLASTIGMLPNLKDLTFITCEVVVNKFLEHLPPGLERLELTNCLELTSDMLVGYFASLGSSLKQLELHHNPALNMAYLTSLQVGCPRLEILKMDLRYFSERVNSNDADPLYDELLGSDDIPTWPSALRGVEFIHLQRLSQTAAEHLFGSLLDNAKTLPDLRDLVIHAHIDIPWRDRAGFRDLWIGRLTRVFLARQKDPAPHLGSLLQYRMWKQSTAKPIVREMSFVALPIHPPSTRLVTETAPRRSQRVIDNFANQVSTPMSGASTSPAPDVSDSSDVESDDEPDEEYFIHRSCRVVDIRIDNQRPRENQFTEGDFLDSEASGDEDWHEGADHEPDARYAW